MLDSGALSSVAENGGVIRVALKEALAAGTIVCVPTIVVAETTTGRGSRDAHVNRVTKRCRIVNLDERIARLAASLRFAKPSFGITDAVVVATADAIGGSIILTTDECDLGELAAQRGISKVVAI